MVNFKKRLSFLLVAVTMLLILLTKMSMFPSRIDSLPPDGTHRDDSVLKASSSALAMEQPTATRVPRIIHYLWCGNGSFEFRNYLSLSSAIFYINPDRIFFYFKKLPKPDRYLYNTWFQELREQTASMQIRPVGDPECETEERRMRYIGRLLLDDGGIYLGQDTMVLDPVWPHMQKRLYSQLSSSTDGFVLASPGSAFGEITTRTNGTCAQMEHVATDSNCVSLKKGLFPKDLWGWRGPLGKAMNMVMYGKEIPQPVKHPHPVVPNIAHMLWLHGREMNFLFYLSCLSLLHVVRVDRLFIHGNKQMSGKYWELLKVHGRVQFIHRPIPNVVYNQVSHSPHHMSDIFRAEVLYKYGGLYSDVDAIWTQPISDEMRSYEATAAYDWAHNYAPYPSYINLGVTMAKPKSRFWKQVWISMKHFTDEIFGFNGLLQPYKVYERDPSLLCIDQHLQVMCFRTSCYPLWGGDYKVMDWRRDTHAFHWTYPDPAEYSSMEVLLNSTGLWADVGQFVLRSAGIIN